MATKCGMVRDAVKITGELMLAKNFILIRHRLNLLVDYDNDDDGENEPPFLLNQVQFNNRVGRDWL